jgi:hypothetical protein
VPDAEVPGVVGPPVTEPDPEVVGGTVVVPEPDPIPGPAPAPGVVELLEPLPIVEPDEPVLGELAEPPTDGEPLALGWGPGRIPPELVPVPGEPPPGILDGNPEVEPDATFGHLGPSGVVVLPEGGVC